MDTPRAGVKRAFYEYNKGEEWTHGSAYIQERAFVEEARDRVEKLMGLAETSRDVKQHEEVES